MPGPEVTTGSGAETQRPGRPGAERYLQRRSLVFALSCSSVQVFCLFKYEVCGTSEILTDSCAGMSGWGTSRQSQSPSDSEMFSVSAEKQRVGEALFSRQP